MERLKSLTLAILLPSLIALTGCEDLVPHDTQSLLDPNMRRSEVVGIVAGFGTRFAAIPGFMPALERRLSIAIKSGIAAKVVRGGPRASRPSLLVQLFYCAVGRDFGMLFGSSAGTGFSGC